MKLSRTIVGVINVYDPERKIVIGKVSKYASYIRSGVFNGDIINHETIHDMGYMGTTDFMDTTTSYSKPKDIVSVLQGKVKILFKKDGVIEELFIDANQPKVIVVPVDEELTYAIISLSSHTVVSTKRTYKTFEISYEKIESFT